MNTSGAIKTRYGHQEQYSLLLRTEIEHNLLIEMNISNLGIICKK